jgi:hypothetical protein
VAILNKSKMACGASSKFESTVMPVKVLLNVKAEQELESTWAVLHAAENALTNDSI